MKLFTLSLFYIFSTLIIVCTAFYKSDPRALNRNVSALLNQLLQEGNYDKRIRPDIGGPPIIVAVNMYIKSFGPIVETDEKYIMDVYFRQSWYDKRLQFNISGFDEFSMSWVLLDKLWKPDTFFLNGMKSHLHRITAPNKFVRIRNDGYLTYSMRLTVTATCKMFLRKFPFDSQTCPLLVGSFGYTSTDVKYKWQSEKPVDIEPNLELAQYDMTNITAIKNKLVTIGKDVHSIIQINFVLKRNTGFFVLQTYVPCSLMVCSSWVSFWIDPDAVPARVSLGVTTVLSITTIGFGGRSQLPKTNYATSLDWFIILCFTFVFAVMIEYAVINFIDKVTQDIKSILNKRKEKKEEDKRMEQEAQDETQSKEDGKEEKGQEMKIDINNVPEEDKEDVEPRNRKFFTKRCYSEPTVFSDFIPTFTFQTESENRLSNTIYEIPTVILKTTKSWTANQLFNFFQILPTEEDISKELETETSPQKFTEIDIASRTYFPLTFTILLSFYFIMYIYIIEDETPLSLYN
uniref:Gamma-aminobutyric acid receptor subunit beta n=1 Tax=Cacopsylla melanoneura TaxID=428564 RepID=A0A8D8T7Z1_9HEMI